MGHRTTSQVQLGEVRFPSWSHATLNYCACHEGRTTRHIKQVIGVIRFDLEQASIPHSNGPTPVRRVPTAENPQTRPGRTRSSIRRSPTKIPNTPPPSNKTLRADPTRAVFPNAANSQLSTIAPPRMAINIKRPFRIDGPPSLCAFHQSSAAGPAASGLDGAVGQLILRITHSFQTSAASGNSFSSLRAARHVG